MKGAKSKKPNSRLAVKKREAKKAKEANKPKRPATAFFVFMEDLRKQYKQKHPNNKSVSVEKAPFVAKAEKRKSEYNKTLQAYNKKLAEGKEEESDKSKSEVHDNADEDETGDDDDE